MDFQNKVAVVTGAGQGVGAACARAFAEGGAEVILLGRTLSKIEAIASSIGDHAHAVACDVSDPDQVAGVFAQIEEDFGKVDILVNNAAVHSLLPIAECSPEDWNKIVTTNLNGTFYCIHSVLPGMIERGYGKIVSMSSSAVKSFIPGFGPYGATKGGIVVLTKTVNEEVKRFGINVNCINLGMTNTEKTRERIGADDPTCQWNLNEMLQVEDVAKVVTWLASDDAKPIMGAAIDCDGLIC